MERWPVDAMAMSLANNTTKTNRIAESVESVGRKVVRWCAVASTSWAPQLGCMVSQWVKSNGILWHVNWRAELRTHGCIHASTYVPTYISVCVFVCFFLFCSFGATTSSLLVMLHTRPVLIPAVIWPFHALPCLRPRLWQALCGSPKWHFLWQTRWHVQARISSALRTANEKAYNFHLIPHNWFLGFVAGRKCFYTHIYKCMFGLV